MVGYLDYENGFPLTILERKERDAKTKRVAEIPKPKTLNPIISHATNDLNTPHLISHAPKSLKQYPSLKMSH